MTKFRKIDNNQKIRNNILSAIRLWANINNLELPSGRRMRKVFEGTCHSDHVSGEGLACTEWKMFKDVVPAELKQKGKPNINVVIHAKKQVEEEIKDKGAFTFSTTVDSNIFTVREPRTNLPVIPRLDDSDFKWDRLDHNSPTLTDENAFLFQLNKISQGIFNGRNISRIGADVLSDMRNTLVGHLDPLVIVFLLEEYALRQWGRWNFIDNTDLGVVEDGLKWVTQTGDLDMLLALAPWKNEFNMSSIPNSNKSSFWDYLVEGGELEKLHLTVPSLQEPFKLSLSGFREVGIFYQLQLFNNSQVEARYEYGHPNKSLENQVINWKNIYTSTMDWWSNQVEPVKEGGYNA